MSQILIDLQVPALCAEYDLFVPDDAPIADIIPLLAKGLADMSSGRYCPSGRELLAARGPERLLDPQKTLSDYAIADGSALMLL